MLKFEFLFIFLCVVKYLGILFNFLCHLKMYKIVLALDCTKSKPWAKSDPLAVVASS